MTHLILASSSPRRKELLSNFGVPFQVIEPNTREIFGGEETAESITRRLALQKGLNVSQAFHHGMVLAADTLVDIDDSVIGKPKTKTEAKNMLLKLRGNFHNVVTGIAWIDIESGVSKTECHKTLVQMRNYTDKEISTFIKTGSPFDKAGGYAIQDTSFNPARKIMGCYTNVVGLPLCIILKTLSKSTLLTIPPQLIDLWTSTMDLSRGSVASTCKGCKTLIKRDTIQL